MLDHDVKFICLLTWACWLAAFALILATWLLDWDRVGAHLGLALSAAGATLHIRQVVIGALEGQQNAFELGRDSAFGDLLSGR